jgi:hypothetical protein
MKNKLGMRNEELGISTLSPRALEMGGWAAFQIPNSYFLIEWEVGWTW